jgi:hypothetical protein
MKQLPCFNTIHQNSATDDEQKIGCDYVEARSQSTEAMVGIDWGPIMTKKLVANSRLTKNDGQTSRPAIFLVSFS